MFRYLLIPLAVAIAAQEKPVLAQTDDIPRSDTVVVTASRLSSSLATTPASATVITREDIEALAPSNAVDLLRSTPGIHIDQPGGLGGVSSIYLRGAEANYTRILIDGVQVNDPTNTRGGSFDVSSIDVSGLERVEIIRGAQSAVYGADSIAGTINFITRESGVEPEYTIFGAFGTSEYARGSVSASAPLSDRAGLSLTAAYTDDGDAVEGSSFHNRSINGKSDIFTSDNSSLRVVFRVADSDSSNFPDDSGGPINAVRRTSDTRDTLEMSGGALFENEMAENWGYTLEVDGFRQREVFSSPGVAGGVRNAFGIPINSSESVYKRGDGRASVNFAPASNFEIVAGGEVRRESGRSSSRQINGGVPSDSQFALSRQTISGFSEARWDAIPGWSLHAGIRLDNPSGFTTETSFSAGSVYTYGPTDTRWKVSWAEGFKLPSFFALGNPIVGDSRLRPETSTSIETSIRQPFLAGRAEVGVSLFRAYYFDTVDFDDTLNRLVNRSETVAWGSEVTGDWQVSESLALGSHLTYVDTDIRDTAEELRNRPKWRAGGEVRWTRMKDVTLTGTALYVGRVLDSSIPTGDRVLNDYTRFDVAVNWRVVPGWDLTMAVDNILDSRYQEVLGFEAPGILPRVSLRVIF
jgi:vitamin B12 transporter